jgi:lipoprotein-anchoring transpeptidase ErfK/SrfK
MMNKILAALLCIYALTARAEAPSEAAFMLQQQINTPFEVLHPNPLEHAMPWIRVGIASQRLTLYDADGREQKSYVISTAKLGAGEQVNSYQTPRGWHRICEKIGDGADANTIIYRRQVTSWHYSPELHAAYPDKDWILARVLWLCGLEPGKNQGEGVDSHDRAIYIHGSGEHVTFGSPSSRGCVRMHTNDVIDLYQKVALGTDVLIEEAR